MREHYIRDAFDPLEWLSAEERTRLEAEAREKALKNEVTLLNEARRAGERRALETVALKLLRSGEPIDKIARATELPVDRIEMLKYSSECSHRLRPERLVCRRMLNL